MSRRGMFRTCLGFPAAAVAVLLLALPAHGDDKAAGKTAPAAGGFLAALPRDTVLVIRAKNIKSLVEKLKKTPLYGLKDHPDVKKLVDKFLEETAPGRANAKKDLGVDPLDALGYFEGEAILAVGNLDTLASSIGEGLSVGQFPNLKPDSIPFVFAADPGTSATQARDYVEKLFQLAEKSGAKRKSVEFHGGKITTLSEGKAGGGKDDAEKGGSEGKDGDSKKGSDTKKAKSDSVSPGGDDKDGAKVDDGKGGDKNDADAPADEGHSGSPDVHVGEMGGRLYVSASRPFLETCMKPGAESLAAHPLFQESSQAVGDGDVSIYLNVKGLTGSVGSALSATMFAFFWQKFDALFFGKSFNNLLVTVGVDDKGVRQGIFLHNGGASDGIAGVFKSESFPPASVPKAIPADAQAYTASAFNPERLGKIVKDVIQTAMAFQGQSADVDTLTEQLLGVKLSELISGLGNRWYNFGGTPNLENPFEGVNYVLDLKDEAPLKKLFDKLSQNPQFNLQSAKFKDRDIYSVDVGRMEIGLCVTEKLLLFSGSKSELEKAVSRIAGSAGGLGENEEFKKLVATVPAQVSMVGYGGKDYAKNTLSALAESAKHSNPEAEVFLGALKALGETLGATVSHASWTEKGLKADSRVQFRAPK